MRPTVVRRPTSMVEDGQTAAVWVNGLSVERGGHVVVSDASGQVPGLVRSERAYVHHLSHQAGAPVALWTDIVVVPAFAFGP